MARVIGLSVDTVGSYGREVIRGVTEFCRQRSDWVVAMEPGLLGDERAPRQGGGAETETWRVDGAIVQAYDADVMARLCQLKIPIVNVSNLTSESYGLSTVLPDDDAIGAMAAKYFLKLGLPRYGFCGHSAAVYSQLRGTSFKRELEAAGAPVFECDTASDSLEQFLASVPKPIGVFCCNDFWAHRALMLSRRLQLQVPDEVALLGVDDDEFLNAISPIPLSSVAIPTRQIGYQAATVLEKLLAGESVPRTTTLPPVEVVTRTTTDVANVEDDMVASAIRFIRDNASKGLSVTQVLEQVSATRRQLERRFRAMVGRSVSTEIRLAHVEAVKHLLLKTSLSIEEIATASGFTNASRMGAVFRRTCRESPSAFRKRNKTDRVLGTS